MRASAVRARHVESARVYRGVAVSARRLEFCAIRGRLRCGAVPQSSQNAAFVGEDRSNRDRAGRDRAGRRAAYFESSAVIAATNASMSSSVVSNDAIQRTSFAAASQS